MASHGVILDGWRWFVMISVRMLQDGFTSDALSLYLNTCQYLLLRLFATSLLPIPDPRSPIPDPRCQRLQGSGPSHLDRVGVILTRRGFRYFYY